MWHTAPFTRLRIQIQRQGFNTSVSCDPDTVVVVTQTGELHMDDGSCQPFCGVLQNCDVVMEAADTATLDCYCPADSCIDVALSLSMVNVEDPVSVCDLHVEAYG